MFVIVDEVVAESVCLLGKVAGPFWKSFQLLFFKEGQTGVVQCFKP